MQFARGLDIETSCPPDSLDEDLAAALQPYRDGHTPVLLHYRNEAAQTIVRLGENWRVRPSTELLAAVDGVPGIRRARLRY
jgi:DNA polymerase-3 subunit alpha